jgi:hypothetical protein
MKRPTTKTATTNIASKRDTSTNIQPIVTIQFTILFPLLIIICAGMYGYIRRRDEINGLNRSQSVLFDLFVRISDTIRQHPLIAEGIIVEWWNSWIDSLRGSILFTYSALMSLSKLLFLTIKPLAYISYYVMIRFILYHILYRTVLQQILLSPTAANQVKGLVRDMIVFQKSLTWKQIMIEICIVASFGIIYQMYHFFKRQTYVHRMKVWRRRRQAAVVQVRHFYFRCSSSVVPLLQLRVHTRHFQLTTLGRYTTLPNNVANPFVF